MASYKLKSKTVPFFRVLGGGLAGLLYLAGAWQGLAAGPVQATSLTLPEVVARSQELYEKTVDMQASFVQEVTIASVKKTEREEGTVTFKNPRMMLWDYKKPKAKKLVINARDSWLYLPEDRMVYVQSSENVYRSRLAVRFLSGIGRLAEDFDFRFGPGNPVDEQGNYHLVLTAREKGAGMDRLELVVSGRNFHVLMCRFNDAFGNTTRLRFSDIRLNTGVPDSLFQFKVPPGVEVVAIQ